LSEHPISHNGCETDHAKVSQHAVQEYLTPGNDNLWAAAIGAHHGVLRGAYVNGFAESGTQWSEQRHALISKLEKQFGFLPREKAEEVEALVAAGLIAVADWIGSDESFFPLEPTLTDQECAIRAANAVEKLGIGPAFFRQGLSFSALFPKLERPTELQRRTVEMITKPGVYVIEGPMGCGKTEAALAAAYNLISSGQATGIYFALPTQTTSNRIHRRILPFVRHARAKAVSVRLAHGASWLHKRQFVTMRLSHEGAEEEASAARIWFASSKRALLTQVGVGTVDQALLGIVAAKHFFVRQFALAGKVVILDEIHTYDLYTSTLIDSLIKKLLELKCTVIILSATLTKVRRETLLGAPSPSNSYPLLSGRHTADSAMEFPIPAEATRDVRVQFRAEDALMEQALAEAQRGACVLWIRNTVQDAQETYLGLTCGNRVGGPPVALLHARFPFYRREQLEAEWMENLGKDSTKRPANGCVLVSTQVVEQSVDIDADLLITDLAPTDMLFQRIGRLWRHERGARMCVRPEMWIRDMGLGGCLETATAKEIKDALGRSGRVYAPYVLVRTVDQWRRLDQVSLPSGIRLTLEETYVPLASEPDAWTELRNEMREQMETQQARAIAAIGVWNLPALDDEEGVQTRYTTLKTANLVLARRIDIDGHKTKIRFLDDTEYGICGPQFDFELAKALHRNMVRVPAWCVHDFASNTSVWLKEYLPVPCVLGVLGELASDGKLGLPVQFGEMEQSGLYYREDLGIVIDKTSSSTPDAVLEDQSEDESND
jgi:CRISPR-associated endonuclease/helicase Cas3